MSKTAQRADTDMMNGLFGATGCNPDGTVGQNAFTSMADQMMEAHFFDTSSAANAMGMGIDGNVVFVESADSHGMHQVSSICPMCCCLGLIKSGACVCL